MTEESQFEPISPPITSASQPQPGSGAAARSTGRSMGCLTGVFGVLLLGVGIPVAWLMGIGIAQVFPGSVRRVPLQEVTLRRTNRVLKTVRHLPQRWQQGATQETRVEPVPIPTTPIEPLTPPPVLNTLEKQIAEEELAALQQELETLKRRLSDLETTLGRAQSTADFESRLQALETGLKEDGPSPNTAESSPPQSVAAPPQPVDPLFQVSTLKITLPSDALFLPGEARLLNTAPTILNRILNDLAPYKGATILIGSHTDDRSEHEVSRTLSLQQANTLQTYLSEQLASASPASVPPSSNPPSSDPPSPTISSFRWVTVGYGLSQPVDDNQTPETRQRNRRIEISVDTR